LPIIADTSIEFQCPGGTEEVATHLDADLDRSLLKAMDRT
jgi:hypothetical protein